MSPSFRQGTYITRCTSLVLHAKAKNISNNFASCFPRLIQHDGATAILSTSKVKLFSQPLDDSVVVPPSPLLSEF